MCLASLALFGVGIMYYTVKFKDTRYSSSLVTIDNMTAPGRYCGICDINYCCALSKTANLTSDSTVRMWYIRSNKHVDIVARLNQPYKYRTAEGSGCIFGGGLILGIIAISCRHMESDDDSESDIPKIPNLVRTLMSIVSGYPEYFTSARIFFFKNAKILVVFGTYCVSWCAHYDQYRYSVSLCEIQR
jgi:hypothetical protein